VLKEPPRVLGRPIQSLEGMAGNTVIFAPPAAPRRRGAAAPATRTVARVSHLRTATGLTLTLTPPNGSHTHISHPGPPLPPCRMAPSSCQHLDLPERPEMLDTLLFSIKRDARNLAERAQKLPPARLLLPSGWYDRAKLRSSWRIIATVLASRETDSRFSAYAAT
jgi:hypothetical protein